jgi:hypothetical protein
LNQSKWLPGKAAVKIRISSIWRRDRRPRAGARRHGGSASVIQSSKGVFLSYASEDAGVAKRICEALRVAGIEVWFDQSELRGGDAWDQKIRQQIRDCALFVPIISAHTQARPEGYFRLEWKLAVDRSHLMAAEKAFLLPVCRGRDDGTRGARADARLSGARRSARTLCERRSNVEQPPPRPPLQGVAAQDEVAGVAPSGVSFS